MKTLACTRGELFPPEQLESRLKCPRCGSRRVTVVFEIPISRRRRDDKSARARGPLGDERFGHAAAASTSLDNVRIRGEPDMSPNRGPPSC